MLVLLLLAGSSLYSQSTQEVCVKTEIAADPPQRITQLSIPRQQNFFVPDIVVSEGSPMKTSEFGAREGAVVAINGSFFDTRSFTMVTYYEEANRVISRNATSTGPTLFNGIIVISDDRELIIAPLEDQKFFETSKAEIEALAAGPLLLSKGEEVALPARPAFTLKRHPRSCLCITEEETLVIAVDGRSETAAGMTLPELQEYLLSLGCRDAINLDGGGSTSLWQKDKGVLNQPSDTGGERRVVNALVWKINSSGE